ncbi:hypothetical protein F2Q70_00022380 [Brassica cretica]|uniref:Uncharacterized protein n=1 Tax=Brassica cretica TaxID=69181 RepID=A0A8S9GLM5_BRACR|nr:hypothetical protein F2Q70_00022380 [Brassica cretica]
MSCAENLAIHSGMISGLVELAVGIILEQVPDPGASGVIFGGLFISFGRAIGIQEEVFYACDLRNFAGEELRSKPCAENLAVHSGMTSGLVELAVGIILELVPGRVFAVYSRRSWISSGFLAALLVRPGSASNSCSGGQCTYLKGYGP